MLNLAFVQLCEECVCLWVCRLSVCLSVCKRAAELLGGTGWVDYR